MGATHLDATVTPPLSSSLSASKAASESAVAVPQTTAEFSAREFRDALGQFATGLAIVTASTPDGGRIGLTISSFNSVSLTPPMVLWSLGLQSSLLASFRDCSHFAIHVLSAQQQDLAQQFAARGIDRFAGLNVADGPFGVPLLEGVIATFVCRNSHRHEQGDHLIFVGDVLHCEHQTGISPLLYHGGKFYTEHPL